MKKQIIQWTVTACLIISSTSIKAQVIEYITNLNDASVMQVTYTSYNGKLYLWTSDFYTREFWVTDGTASGTQIVKDINTIDEGFSSLAPAVTYDGKMYFVANGGNTGLELWRSNGTENGTGLVKDINPGSDDGFDALNRSLTLFDGRLFFRANFNDDEELWVSDGTMEGTMLLKDLAIGSSTPKFLTPATNQMFFHAENEFGRELWVSDGTAEGTLMVKNIQNGGDGLLTYNFERVAYGNRLLFSADNGVHGRELWVSDGTTVGTYMLKDLRSGEDGSSPANFFVFNDLVFFSAANDNQGSRLWISDGTADGTFMLPVYGYPDNYLIYNDMLYFTTNERLWRTDGTSDGTEFIKSVDVFGKMITYDSKILFLVKNNSSSYQFWESDGTTAGTVPISSTFADIEDDIFSETFFVKHEGAVYFVMSNENDGTDLWRYRVVVTDTEDAIAETNTFKVFPNPAYHTIQINNAAPTTIQISNSLGQVYTQQEIQANTPINIRQLPPGRYFITNKSNHQSAAFIKHKP